MAGWDEVNAAIKEAPVCEYNQQIVMLLNCKYRVNYVCKLCARKGADHLFSTRMNDENTYDKCFIKRCHIGEEQTS